ncbi:pneumococcal-type histidine triad protein [Streptococcus rifensis]
MKSSKKALILAGIALSCHLCLAGCQNNQEKQETASSSTAQTDKALVVSNTEEKAENLVVVASLTENGYERLIGKDLYPEIGPVPFTAKFLKETVAPKSYDFDKKDVLYQLEKGYIVKVSDEVYYYPEETGANIIEKTEAEKLTKNQTKPTKQASSSVPGVDKPTDDGFLLTDEKQIISKTSEGIVVDHNGHSHFLFYSDLKDSKWSYLIPKDFVEDPKPRKKAATTSDNASHSLDDGYVFNPNDIVAEDANGYTVRHGDHFHYILKSQLGQINRNAAPSHNAQLLPNQNTPSPRTSEPDLLISNPPTTQTDRGIPGIHYPTSDGFQFDGSNVTGKTALGILVNHNGHSHLIPFDHLRNTPWEHLIPKGTAPSSIRPIAPKTILPTPNPKPVPQKPAKPAKPAKPSKEALELAKKKAYLASQFNIPEESIQITDGPNGKIFVYPHDDHYHSIDVDKIVIGEPIEDPHGDPHAHQKIGMETLRKLGFDEEIIIDILHATASSDFPATETSPERMKDWLKTVKSINIGQRENPLERKGLDLMPNIEILGIGCTTIRDIKPVFQFKHLKQLLMTKTGIKDYSFMKEIPTLEGIDLSQNELSDLSFLADYPHFKYLAANGNGIKDISVLAKLPHLETLNLDYNQISDLTALKPLQNLQAVSLDANDISNLEVLNDKKQLERLFVSNNQNLQLSTLKNPQLKHLIANESLVNNLDFLQNNPHLETVSVNKNELTSLKGVEKAKQLSKLSANNNRITSLKIEGKQESLKNLDVDNNNLTSLEGINDYTALQTIDADYNNIQTLKLDVPNKTINEINVSHNHIPQSELETNENNVPKVIVDYYPEARSGNLSANTEVPQLEEKKSDLEDIKDDKTDDDEENNKKDK